MNYLISFLRVPKNLRCERGLIRRSSPFLLSAFVGATISMGQTPPHTYLTPFEDPSFEILGPALDHLAWTPGLAPTAIDAEIQDVSAPRKGYLYIPGVSKGFDYAAGGLEDLYKRTGLQIGTAYTMLFQGLSGGPWGRFGAAGDWDLMTSWTLIGKDTENTGKFLFDVENRFEIGGRTPNSLGAQIATLQATANTFNDRGWVVRDFLWEQHLWHGQFRFLLGRADSTDYFGSTWLQSANNSFVNRTFASGSTVAAPGHGPAAGISFEPKDGHFYITGGAANAYNSTTTTGFSSLDQWTFFTYGEVGWTPEFKCLGEGRYTVSYWHVGEREKDNLPQDWGLTGVIDQQLSPLIDVFARYGYAEEAILNIRHYAQGGVGYRPPIGATNDFTGIAFSYVIPKSSASRDEKVLEGFYRLQLARFAQFSVGAQAIFDPGNGPSHDIVGAFWGRVRIMF